MSLFSSFSSRRATAPGSGQLLPTTICLQQIRQGSPFFHYFLPLSRVQRLFSCHPCRQQQPCTTIQPCAAPLPSHRTTLQPAFPQHHCAHIRWYATLMLPPPPQPPSQKSQPLLRVLQPSSLPHTKAVVQHSHPVGYITSSQISPFCQSSRGTGTFQSTPYSCSHQSQFFCGFPISPPTGSFQLTCRLLSPALLKSYLVLVGGGLQKPQHHTALRRDETQ